ncbi:MAG: AAA family ATPase, partial [Methanoregula sp.]
MRILSLHFKNLNSLAGEWTIDFTNPEYISSGIFAITGPTGAGKSTILDAITLALYGRTPRLGKISKNASEIMSRQTGEYFSEVEFVSEKGRYRCRWSQKRAHKKPDCDLQPPRHEIVDAETGIPLETKQAAVQEKVIAVTGLDYQQFTRSILLAQGDFATFLDAKADERAPILEKITGTGIYGEISIAVHERFGKEKAALDTLFAKADTIETISPEQAAALKKELEQHQQDIRETARRCKEREAAVTWLDTLAALETEIARLEERAQALAKRRAAAEKDLGALSLARRARDLDGMYSSLFALRGQQEHETQEKTACEGRLLGLSAAYASTLEAVRLAQDRNDRIAGKKQREDELCRRVRDLDARIREVKTRRDERTREKQRLLEETGTLRDAIRSAEAQAEVIRQERVQVTEYLNGHPRDEKLISSLSGIASAVRQIHATEESAETKQDALRGVEQTLADAEQVVLRRKSELDRAAGRVQDVLAASARIQTHLVKITGGRDSAALRVLAEEDTERGHRLRALVDILARIDEDEDVLTKLAADLDAARGRRTVEEKRHTGLIKDAEKAAEILRLSEENRIYLARLKKFEEDRQALTDGKPCPLCGSTVHPWCTGAAPEPGDAEKKHAAYKKENEDFQAQLHKSEADLAGIDGGIQAGEAALRDREAQAKKARAELDAGCRALGIPAGPDTKPA